MERVHWVCQVEGQKGQGFGGNNQEKRQRPHSQRQVSECLARKFKGNLNCLYVCTKSGQEVR